MARGGTRRAPDPEDGDVAPRAGRVVGEAPPLGGSRPLFPLRLRCLQGAGKDDPRRYIARRLRAREQSEVYLARAVRALNALADARGDGVLRLSAPSYAVPGDPLSAAQSTALGNLSRSIRACLPAPARSDLCADGALCALLRSRDIYDVEQSCAVQPYDPDKLKVLRGQTVPKDARALVGDTAGEFLLHSATRIERAADDPVFEGALPQPHWDARLRLSRRVRRDFILRLHAVGLVAWRRRAKQQAGIFFVAKKDDTIRMVVDCRPANESHLRPPHSALATAGALGAINLAPSFLAEAGCASDFLAHGAAVDLSDGYYQFKVPELASWFALGERFTAGEVGITSAYCDDAREDRPVAADEVLWACFGAMPMGWSWGLYFCHESLSECCRRAMHATQPTVELLEDRRPPPRLSTNSAFVAPYVDNGNIIAGSQSAAKVLLTAVQHELSAVGFVYHEVVEPTRRLDLLGRTLDLELGTLRPSQKRLWRLWYALDELLARPALSKNQMRVVLGHLVDTLCMRRELLSVLCLSYSFVGTGGDDVLRLPREVCWELEVCRDVLLLVYVDLRREPCPRMYCSDASKAGYALHSSPVCPAEFWKATAHKERWRFTSRRTPPAGGGEASRGVEASFDAAPLFNAWAEAELEEEATATWDGRVVVHGCRGDVAVAQPRTEDEPTGVQIPPLDDEIVDPTRWHLVVARPWRSAGVIHHQEGRAALLGLRREAHLVGSHNKVLLSLGDNLAEVLVAERGRARDRGLLSLARQAAAHQVAANIGWKRRYVETDRNPSDKDSREPLVAAARLRRERHLVAPWAPPPGLPPVQTVDPGAVGRGTYRALVAGGQPLGAGGTRLVPRPAPPTSRPAPCAPPPGLALVALPTPPPGLEPKGAPLRSGTWSGILEVFAGHCIISRACRDIGLRILEPLDLRHGPHHDLRLPAVVRQVVSWLAAGLIWVLWLAPPCTSWSPTKVGNGPAPDAETCGAALVRLLRAARRYGVPVVVENPQASRLWQWPPLSRELVASRCEFVTVDMCCFDAAWRKPTKLCGNLAGLSGLACRCPGHAEHVRLQGTVEHGGVKLWRTSFAAAYPHRLGRAVAELFSYAAGPAAWARPGEVGPDSRWSRHLAAASHAPDPGALVLERLGRRTYLGWEGSTGHWDGQPVDAECRVLRDIFTFNRRTRPPLGTAAPAVRRRRHGDPGISAAKHGATDHPSTVRRERSELRKVCRSRVANTVGSGARPLDGAVHGAVVPRGRDHERGPIRPVRCGLGAGPDHSRHPDLPAGQKDLERVQPESAGAQSRPAAGRADVAGGRLLRADDGVRRVAAGGRRHLAGGGRLPAAVGSVGPSHAGLLQERPRTYAEVVRGHRAAVAGGPGQEPPVRRRIRGRGLRPAVCHGVDQCLGQSGTREHPSAGAPDLAAVGAAVPGLQPLRRHAVMPTRPPAHRSVPRLRGAQDRPPRHSAPRQVVGHAVVPPVHETRAPPPGRGLLEQRSDRASSKGDKGGRGPALGPATRPSS